MTNQGRGPRARPEPDQTLREDLLAAFSWRSDDSCRRPYADVTGWWGDPSLLAGLGPALAGLFAEEQPSVILGPQSRGALLGTTVALHLRRGLAEVRKDPGGADSDRWVCATTPPDYRDRNLRLGVRRELIPVGAKALFVDDWIDTGGQAIATRKIVDAAGAHWLGAAVIVDSLQDPQLRRRLRVRSLFRGRELGDN